MGGLASQEVVRINAEIVRVIQRPSPVSGLCLLLMLSGRGRFFLTTSADELGDFHVGSRYNIEGHLLADRFDDKPWIESLSLLPLDLWPRSLISFDQTLEDIFEFPMIEQLELVAAPIKCDLVRFFFYNALNQAMSEGFFSAPASKDNHHAFEGGLAAHSVETGALFYSFARYPTSLPQWQMDVGLAASLLHDVGKLVPKADQPKIEPAYLRHEAAGLDLLAKPLRKLESYSTDLANAMRYCLYGHRLDQSESGRLIHCLRKADQYSAASCNEAVALAVGNRDGSHVQLASCGGLRSYYAPEMATIQ